MSTLTISPPSTPVPHCRLPGQPSRPSALLRTSSSSSIVLNGVTRFSPEQPTYLPPPNYSNSSNSERTRLGPRAASAAPASAMSSTASASASMATATGTQAACTNTNGHHTLSSASASSPPTARPPAAATTAAVIGNCSSSATGGSLLQRRKSSSASQRGQRPNFSLSELKLEAIPPPPLANLPPDAELPLPLAAAALEAMVLPHVTAATATEQGGVPVDVQRALAHLDLDDTIREEVIGESSAAVTPLPLDDNGQPIQFKRRGAPGSVTPGGGSASGSSSPGAGIVVVERPFRPTKTFVSTPFPEKKAFLSDEDEDEDEDDADEGDDDNGETTQRESS